MAHTRQTKSHTRVIYKRGIGTRRISVRISKARKRR